MSSQGNYKPTYKSIKWSALLPLWMQKKNKDRVKHSGKLAHVEDLKGLSIEHAKGMVNDAVNRHLNHLTQTQVYMMLVELMVDCQGDKDEIAKEIYDHCDMITNKWDNESEIRK